MNKTITLKAAKKYLLTPCILLASSGAFALQLTTTDLTEFQGAVDSIIGIESQLIDFESEPVGFINNPINGVSFSGTFELPGYSLGIDDSNPGTSGTHYLGSTDDGINFDQFALGESLNISFSEATHAFGAYIISSDLDFFADDITVNFGGQSITNPVGRVGSDINGVNALFLGLVDTENAFTSATVQFGATPGDWGVTLFELDDVRYTAVAPIPIPGAFWLLGSGLLGIWGIWGLRRQQGRS